MRASAPFSIALVALSACSEDSGVHSSRDAAPLVDARADGSVRRGSDGATLADARRNGDSGGLGRCSGEAGSACSTSSSSKSLWNGVDLKDWDGDPSIWHVAAGAIEGYAPAGTVKEQTFLVYTGGTFGDFALTADVYVEGNGNSGIQYRSTVVDAAHWVVSGYQADMGQTYWGDLYEDWRARDDRVGGRALQAGCPRERVQCLLDPRRGTSLDPRRQRRKLHSVS